MKLKYEIINTRCVARHIANVNGIDFFNVMLALANDRDLKVVPESFSNIQHRAP
jgi:hypothetical protein